MSSGCGFLPMALSAVTTEAERSVLQVCRLLLLLLLLQLLLLLLGAKAFVTTTTVEKKHNTRCTIDSFMLQISVVPVLNSKQRVRRLWLGRRKASFPSCFQKFLVLERRIHSSSNPTTHTTTQQTNNQTSLALCVCPNKGRIGFRESKDTASTHFRRQISIRYQRGSDPFLPVCVRYVVSCSLPYKVFDWQRCVCPLSALFLFNP